MSITKPTSLTPVNNAATELDKRQVIFLLGRTGSGKSTQFLTLPGRKFAYLFEPSAKVAIQGYPIDFLEFLPEEDELEYRLKGFNQNTLTDRKGGTPEPTIYTRWYEDFTARLNANFFESYDWVEIDSFTFLVQAMIDRQMFLNKRTGEPPDRGDYRIVGDSLRAIIRALTGRKVNVFLTGHIQEYQDEKTKIITTQANLPGSARTTIPLMCTNIWQTDYDNALAKKYTIRTRPDKRGMRDLRCSIASLKDDEDITITDLSKPIGQGIGGLLLKAGFKVSTPASTPAPVAAVSQSTGAST